MGASEPWRRGRNARPGGVGLERGARQLLVVAELLELRRREVIADRLDPRCRDAIHLDHVGGNREGVWLGKLDAAGPDDLEIKGNDSFVRAKDTERMRKDPAAADGRAQDPPGT